MTAVLHRSRLLLVALAATFGLMLALAAVTPAVADEDDEDDNGVLDDDNDDDNGVLDDDDDEDDDNGVEDEDNGVEDEDNGVDDDDDNGIEDDDNDVDDEDEVEEPEQVDTGVGGTAGGPGALTMALFAGAAALTAAATLLVRRFDRA